MCCCLYKLLLVGVDWLTQLVKMGRGLASIFRK
jgi:hypothetical protein